MKPLETLEQHLPDCTKGLAIVPDKCIGTDVNDLYSNSALMCW